MPTELPSPPPPVFTANPNLRRLSHAASYLHRLGFDVLPSENRKPSILPSDTVPNQNHESFMSELREVEPDRCTQVR